MKQIAVLSGKGGTGKTTVASALIQYAAAKGIVIADCDVDAPNLGILFPDDEVIESLDFSGLDKAAVDEMSCIGCGICEKNCQFKAIKINKVDLHACEGCGVCELLCPAKRPDGSKAVRLEKYIAGKSVLAKSGTCMISRAELFPGNGASGKLVTQVKKNAAEIESADYMIIDGSPGIGCPVIASLSGTNYLLIVTEPSLSGFSDMKRLKTTAALFGSRMFACINRADINPQLAGEILQYCSSENISVLGCIPYDEKLVDGLNRKMLPLATGGPAAQALMDICENLFKAFAG